MLSVVALAFAPVSLDAYRGIFETDDESGVFEVEDLEASTRLLTDEEIEAKYPLPANSGFRVRARTILSSGQAWVTGDGVAYCGECVAGHRVISVTVAVDDCCDDCGRKFHRAKTKGVA